MGEKFGFAVQIGALTNATRLLWRAPSASNGGGVRILSAQALSGTTVSSLSLVKMSAAGTPAANGTLGSVGGTADAFVSGAPKNFTLDEDYSFLDAGEWLAVKEGNVQACDAGAVVSFQCEFGK